MRPWRFWTRGEQACDVEVDTPRLASWMSRTHPDQVRLRTYLEDLIPRLAPLPAGSQPLFLHMEIAVSDAARLLNHHDLENYLTPLFGTRWLNPSRFVLVTAAKRVGGVNRITVGYAAGPMPEHLPGWYNFSTVLDGGLTVKRRKLAVRDELAKCTRPLQPGPVELRLAWRCSSRRNWTSLWKPTGDTMGPVLGTTRDAGFHPQDDRIVSLALHREIDDALKNTVHVGMWWRSQNAV
jgi:hypothetical protein